MWKISFAWILIFSSSKIVLCEEIMPGIVALDDKTFDKIISKFKYAFVKFENFDNSRSRKGPSEELSIEFDRLSKEILWQNENLLSAQMTMVWGTDETKRFAKRFQIADNLDLPELILFSVDKEASKLSSELVANETRYGGDSSNMLKFLKGKTGLYLGLGGCLKEFDELAEVYARNVGGMDREKVTREAERALQTLEKDPNRQKDVQSAKTYLKVMTSSGQELGSYLEREKKRIANILNTKNVESGRRKEFEKKLNILKSFE